MDADVAALVTAAQGGDRRALAELVAIHLPLVYNIVGRALDSPADTDDVVQDTMVRAVRDLAALRTPESFRTWLAAIAVRQVGTHRQQKQAASARTAPLEETAGRADPDAPVEDVTALRADLSAQRREVAEAGRWLDPDDRTLLAFWWQEVAGLMSRGEIAEALDLGVAHTGVRIQRMREQLDLSRTIVAALHARPMCPQLTALAATWDGRPGPLWRKRLARHVRPCPVCSATTRDRVRVERLLAAVAVLTVPAGLAQAVLAKSTAAVAGTLPATAAVVGTKITLTGLIAGHPVAAAVAGTAAVAALTVPVVYRVDPHQRAPEAITTPAARATSGSPRPTPRPTGAPSSAAVTPSAPGATPSAGVLTAGRLSLEWSGGGYVTGTAATGVATVTGIAATSDPATRQRATFTAVAGLADATCFSFRTDDGRYLRHYELLAYTHPANNTPIFREDATWCPQPGVPAGSVRLRSHNYPQFYLRWTGTELRINYVKETAEFQRTTSFRIRSPLAP
ncbi:hypothetical protein Ate01nite_67760 [Actinoplanes teichomyceticus]|nr:hypothetical protein Ate01nite_67760 [Actinoplanes teichomyceticus]